ncbi:MAG: CpaD family pilus assembly lipoprotein [Pseudomonadota bacterium]
MRKAALLFAVLLSAGCQSADPAAYHHELAHPYRLTEASVRLSLAGMTAENAASQARDFAAERPNNGSTFIVSAPTEIANAVRVALLRSGIDAREIRLVPEGEPAEVVRTDRFATVVDCIGPPQRQSFWDNVFGTEDGFRHDNSNSKLLGCAVRRNIVEMTDDPRALGGPVHQEGREGTRGADVWGKYSTGQSPAAGVALPTWSTTK